jgi:hypothetical protein
MLLDGEIKQDVCDLSFSRYHISERHEGLEPYFLPFILKRIRIRWIISRTDTDTIGYR